ncbi:hypothetical protein KUTG_09966 [Kutzneria sp. 744]|nr:hypothetical protein KUTG_09966 [Kutzneria sp. 744]
MTSREFDELIAAVWDTDSEAEGLRASLPVSAGRVGPELPGQKVRAQNNQRRREEALRWLWSSSDTRPTSATPAGAR